MANHQTQIDRAWQLLAPALGSDLRIIQREVKQGLAQLISWGDGEFYTVLRGETAATGNELVIVGGAGKNAAKWTALIHQQARAQGFKTVRLHTLKPDAMLRLGKGLGYHKAETILRAEL
ncbi:hypothetical protein [Shewanella dokdonensis]|uniref:Uncharacterized protein n=1 Tax=Shewanella dokdonensis TaxID=712036 RepID=A0ABX8DFT0_9GAMM|nr:hypothetical protein [Shewanella dokdonensis]MCL1072994.1 hypothetical protein [Shewanella dokdonensis]QVK23091.1 hypothetical protein KHX94_18665 [Shewanella dokdonensis]